ncbi:hypothetical protein [Thermococcus thioreducens]|nr:hypothetical protein [Thermococcus thioreducens]
MNYGEVLDKLYDDPLSVDRADLVEYLRESSTFTCGRPLTGGGFLRS